MTTQTARDDALRVMRAFLAGLGEKAPFAGDIVAAFGELALLRTVLRAELADAPLIEAPFDPDRFSQGVPVLRRANLTPLAGPLGTAAARLLPDMARLFPVIAEELDRLATALAARPELTARLPAALLGASGESPVLAEAAGVTVEVLDFAARQALKPALERQAQALAGLLEDSRWNRGYCPVCGGQPGLGLLRAKAPEPTEFLISKSGQLWLHCADCAHSWRFARVTCPSCGGTEHEQFSSQAVEGVEDERFYACRRCRRYFVCVDLREQPAGVPLDLIPLGLLHLDLAAQRQGFAPLARLPWNQFS